METIVIIAIMILLLSYLYFRRKRLDFPGPPQWPVIGNVTQIDRTRALHWTFSDWADKYGRVCHFKLFNNEFLLISDWELLHEMLVTRGSEFSGRHRNYILNIFSGDGSNIVFSQPDTAWKNLRKLSHSSLKMYERGMEKIESVSQEMVGLMVQDLVESGGAPTDVRELMYYVTTSIMASLMVGRNYPRDSEYFRCHSEVDKRTFALVESSAGVLLDAFPWIRPFWNPTEQTARDYLQASQNMYDMVKREAKKSESEGFHDSLVSVFMRAVERGDISDKNLKYVLSDLVLGGSLTTTNTTYALWNVLIHYPDVQRRLQEEVDEVVGARMVSLEDKAKMPYHMAVMYEILRFTTILPFSVTHAATKDTMLEGKFIPEGTKIMFNQFGVNHNEQIFPEPYVFKPERFLDEVGDVVPADHITRKAMKVFGAGPRVCLGETLAKSRIFLIIAGMMQKFEIRAVENCELVSCDPRTYKGKGLIAHQEYKARFIPRE